MRLVVIIVLLILVLAASALAGRPSLGAIALEDLKQEAEEQGSVRVIVSLDETLIDDVGLGTKAERRLPKRLKEKLRVRLGRSATVSLEERREAVKKVREEVLETLDAKGKAAGRRLQITGMAVSSRVVSVDAVEDAVEGTVEPSDENETDVKIVHEFAVSTGFTADLTAEGIDLLASTPGVTAITKDVVFQLTLADSVPQINADEVWNRSVGGVGVSGAGQTVCVLDTGVDFGHEAFTGRIVDSRCYLSSDQCPDASDITNASDDDPSSHGTHVSGTVLGNSSTITGVAPQANLIAIKVCNASGSCFLSAMSAGVDYCVNESATYNISAISLSISNEGHYDSLGVCPYDATLENAINAAYALGIVVSIASGNDGGSTGIGYPACIPNATSVGSVTSGDSMSSFTQTGTLLKVLAPGSSVNAPLRNNAYGSKSGTSMATPHIAGVAALLHNNERLRGRTLTAGLLEDLMTERTNTYVSGFPRVDALEGLIYRNLNASINRSQNEVILPDFGRLKFGSSTDLDDFDSCVNFTSNRIEINASECSDYNQSAQIDFYNLTFDFTPVVMLDGVACSDCSVINFTGGVFTFNVTHFSSYTAGANTNLTIWDDTDTEAKAQYSLVSFFANYTNATSGEYVNGSGVSCDIRFNTTGTFGAFESMSFNDSSLLYAVNRTFSAASNNTFQVLCNGTALGFEMLNVTDDFNITAESEAPVVQLVSPVNNSNVTTSNLVHFTYNVSDNTGVIANCSLLLNGTVNASVASPAVNINQTFNLTVTNGVYSWAVQCIDSAELVNTSTTFTININVTNVAPTLLTNISNVTVDEDVSIQINVSAAFNDTNGDPLTWTTLHAGSLDVNMNNNTGNATITGASNASGTYYIVFVAHDVLDATTESNNVTVTITAVNDAPTFISTIPDETWDEGAANNDAFDLDNYFSDIDNSTLNYTVTGQSSITVTIDSNNDVTFTQSSSYTGTESITFTATDGEFEAASNTVDLEVEAVAGGGGGGGGGGGSSGTCTNQCSPAGVVGCSGAGAVLECGNFDADTCLEMRVTQCGPDEVCTGGQCVSACLPDWSCAEWNPCSDGWQTRTCTDVNNCTLATGKPDETQVCSSLETAARPAVGPQPLKTVATDSVNESGIPNVTGAAVCGDGSCQLTEWCMQDCKTRNVKAPVIIVLLGGLAVVVMRHGRRLMPPRGRKAELSPPKHPPPTR